MSKFNGSALMFNAEDVRDTVALMPRLVRIFFYRLRITNDGYLERYHRHLQQVAVGMDARAFGAQTNADRKTLRDVNGLTYKKMHSVMAAMGEDIESVTVVTRNRRTKQLSTFSTNDTVEMIDKHVAEESEGGVASFLD